MEANLAQNSREACCSQESFQPKFFIMLYKYFLDLNFSN